MKTIRVYADTSVFGGVYDEDFEEVSHEFFSEVKRNRFTLVTSAVVQAEIIDVSEESLLLRDAYLEADVVTPKYSDDALHVALATVSNCTLIVSWNFKHIVHFEKIPLYNAVNTLNEYPEIKIFSPLEVIKYEDY